jgi:hypothetical protein
MTCSYSGKGSSGRRPLSPTEHPYSRKLAGGRSPQKAGIGSPHACQDRISLSAPDHRYSYLSATIGSSAAGRRGGSQ